MSARALQTIWSWVALALLTLGGLGFVRITGVSTHGEGSMLEASGILSFAPSEVADLLVPMQLALLSLLLLLTRLWTRQLGGEQWPTRMPVFFFGTSDVDPRHPGGAWFQRVNFVICLCLPLIFALLFISSYLRATIWFAPAHGEPVSTNISGLAHFATEKIYSAKTQSGTLRLGTGTGPEYFPFLTWVYAIWLVAVVLYFVWVCIIGLFGTLKHSSIALVRAKIQS